MNNFWQRLITGTVFVATIIAAIFYGPLSFQLLFLIVSLLSLKEFYLMVRNDHKSPNEVLGLIFGGLIYIIYSGMFSNFLPEKYSVIIYPLSIIIFIAELYRKKQEPFTNIGFTFLGIFYAVLPFALLNKVAAFSGNYDSGLLIGYFIILWCSDTFAYVFGNLLGKTKLFERISPKKSWEGSIGGGVFALIAACILWQFNPQISLQNWLVVAAIIIVTGTLGDLTESMLKRSLDIKDSGTLLPGHGGMLDRFDGLLLSVPAVWAYLVLFC